MIGTIPWYTEIAPVQIESGRFISSTDVHYQLSVCVVGTTESGSRTAAVKMSDKNDSPASSPGGSLLLAFGISVMVGLTFGLYPAWHAANMNPIESLRHE